MNSIVNNNSLSRFDLKDHISDIHIKDLVRGGGPVVLGEGDADFDSFFNKLKAFDYSG
jgi:sugar phosphate isomerase/epimerase